MQSWRVFCWCLRYNLLLGCRHCQALQAVASDVCWEMGGGSHEWHSGCLRHLKKRFCFAFKGPKRPKGPNWVQLMNLAQASLMSFFSLTPKIIQVRICQDKQISDKRSAQLWGMLQFEFSFLICPDHICLLKCMQNAKFVASSCCYSSLDAFCITGRAAQLQLGHARMFLLRALDLDLDGLSRRNRPACDNGEGTELGSHGWPGVTQREKKNGKVMQNEKCHFYSL